ncbi:MAG: hypothetical protein AAF636_27630 [Pseudomonadota bacterium]
MADILKICRASTRALVARYGCYDAVASLVSARFGVPASKGTISKKMAGHNEWTLPEIIALEDEAGEYPVTRALARRLKGQPENNEQCLLKHGASIAKEAGEAIAAVLSAQSAAQSGEVAEAIRELDELMHAARQARARLENL